MAMPSNSKSSGFQSNPFGGPGLGAPLMGKGGLSVDTIRDFITERKLETGIILFLLVTVFATYSVFTGNIAKVQELDESISALKAKEDPLGLYKRSLKKTEEFLKDVPPAIPESNLIVFLTDLAQKRGIKITSITPPKSQREGFYVISTIQIKCAPGSFKDALRFLDDIEKSESSARVFSWSFTDAGKMDISVSSVSLIENGKKNAEKKR